MSAPEQIETRHCGKFWTVPFRPAVGDPIPGTFFWRDTSGGPVGLDGYWCMAVGYIGSFTQDDLDRREMRVEASS